MLFFILTFFLSLTNTINSSLRPITLTKQQYIYSLSSNPINVSISLTESSFYSIPISLGTPSQQFNTIIATSSNSLLITDIDSSIQTKNKYNSSSSSTSVKNNDFQFTPFYDRNLMFGFSFKDVLNISNMSLQNFTFISALGSSISPAYMQDGIIGFNRNNSNIMYSLKQNQIIEKNIFSIYDPSNNTNNAYLYIGEYHENFTKSSNIIAFCNCTNSTVKWSCNPKKIFIGNINDLSPKKEYLEITEDVIFDSGSNAMIFPLKYKYELMKNISSKCKLNSIEDIEYITCPKKQRFDIVLGIDELGLRIKQKYLWEIIDNEPNNERYALNIFFKNVDFFIFGVQIFKEYHIAFDDDTKKITFYSPTGLIFDLGNVKQENIELLVGLISGSILSFVIIFLLYKYCCKNKGLNEIEKEILKTKQDNLLDY